MRFEEIINESISSIVFHYTNAYNALKILQTGQFQLASTLGSIEQQYAPKGHPYFLSTTRTRQGGYHDIIGSTAVLFVLDGNWFNSRYPGKSVDYWLNRNPMDGHHRAHEAEDRVFSKEPTIPIDGIKALHLYVSENADPEARAVGRKVLLLAKKLNIETDFYTDKTAWKNFDQRKTADISLLKGKERTGGYISLRKGYLLPWIQLIKANERSQLDKKANDLRYSLQYTYDSHNAAQGLANDLSNARKPDSGPDRKFAIEIINYMQKNKLNSINDLVNHLSAKWKNKS
jgi:hypothetical protein